MIAPHRFNLSKLDWLIGKSQRTLSLLIGFLTDHLFRPGVKEEPDALTVGRTIRRLFNFFENAKDMRGCG